MICCQDDRQHLHVLARLCRMLYDEGFVDDVRHAGAVEEIMERMRAKEAELLGEVGKRG